MQAVGRSCTKVGAEDIKRYVSTASLAEDLLALTEAHGACREREAARVLSARSEGLECILQALRHWVGERKYNVMAFLCLLLSAQHSRPYPDRIARFGLDGVVNSADYTTSSDKKKLPPCRRRLQRAPNLPHLSVLQAAHHPSGSAIPALWRPRGGLVPRVHRLAAAARTSLHRSLDQ